MKASLEDHVKDEPELVPAVERVECLSCPVPEVDVAEAGTSEPSELTSSDSVVLSCRCQNFRDGLWPKITAS